MTEPHDTPVRLDIAANGSLAGSTRTYRKCLEDMAGIYHDLSAYEAALESLGAQQLVYQVQEQKYDDGEGALIVGTSTLLPGRYGEEFAVTRGHIHQRANRAELYYCLSGRGIMLLETVDGRSEAVELIAGQAVNVPGQWVHRSVNVGDVPFVTLFSYAADAGQNYHIIAQAGGMKELVVTDGGGGWRTIPNPRHRGYSSDAS